MTLFDPIMNIYIPHIYPNWANKKKIKKIFENLDIGIINKIDLIKTRKKNTIYYQAHIFFEFWFDTNQNRNIQEKINNNDKTAKIVYDDPWYWILLKSNKLYNTLDLTNNLKTDLNKKILHKIFFVENYIKENRTLIENNRSLINSNIKSIDSINNFIYYL